MHTADVSALIIDVCQRLILPRFRSLAEGEVEQKHPGDPVTIADRQAEAALTQALGEATPEALIVGEEAVFFSPGLVDGLADAPHAWVIDPVDGTRNFASGSEDFGVMLAETRAGETMRAWIWQPLHDALYVAERGKGVTLNGVELKPLAPRESGWRVAAWPHAPEAAGEGEVPVVWGRTRGSCAIDYPALARGEVEALAYRTIHPWDHLPGALMVRELGGEVIADGVPYGMREGGRVLTVGASPIIAAALQARLNG